VPAAEVRLPRVLFLSPVVPAPLDRGQNVRIHHLVAGLARRFRVTLVVPEGPGLAEESELWTAVERVVPVPVPSGSPAAYRRVLDGLPLREFDAVWVERTGLAGLVRRLGRRVVVDFDDLEHRNTVRELRSGSASPRRLAHAGRMFGRELVLARRFGACTVASEVDLRYLRRWGLRRGALLPNGTAVEPATQRRSGGGLVFVGNLGYSPNLDGLAWFEESVRPALDRAGVRVELTVLGPGVTDAIAARFPRVDFRGFVPDLSAALAGFDAAIVPLRLGGGTKLKLLDALAAGLPVVTTPIGAEGLRVRDGEHLLVADGAEPFAAAVRRLLADPSLAGELGERGRKLVAEQYSWRAVQDRAVALVDRVIG
jgi:glycosyltransferase involved in cell wall biosynthesis